MPSSWGVRGGVLDGGSAAACGAALVAQDQRLCPAVGGPVVEDRGRYALIYMRNQRGFTPPPHRHGPEACYVIRGRLWFDIAGEKIIATEGYLVNAPPSVWHAFRVESDEPEYLLTFSPPGMEQLFFRAGKPARALEPPAGCAGPPDLAQLQAIATALGIETAPPGSSVRDLSQAR